MNKYVLALGMTGAMLTAGLVALPAQAAKAVSKEAGSLVVYGNAESKLFTQEGIDRAKSAFAGVQFDHGLHLTIDTYAELPEGKKAAFTALGEDKARKDKFFKDWAHERATDEKAKGPFVLVCRKPGHIEVRVDQQSRDRGFTEANQAKLREILQSGFQSAKDKPDVEQFQIRDAALKSAIDYVISDLKGTTVAGTANAANHSSSGGSFLSKYGSYLCIGVVVILVIWLIIGVIRAMSGGGGGGGMGGGGGGGGFMTSMFGGLFGAMAGMWLYNNLLGGGSMFGGSDSSSYGDSGGGGDGDTGAGDYSGDAGSGSDFDGGSGGGDYGGGGDWGGGGGDFGGGGGDF